MSYMYLLPLEPDTRLWYFDTHPLSSSQPVGTISAIPCLTGFVAQFASQAKRQSVEEWRKEVKTLTDTSEAEQDAE